MTQFITEEEIVKLWNAVQEPSAKLINKYAREGSAWNENYKSLCATVFMECLKLYDAERAAFSTFYLTRLRTRIHAEWKKWGRPVRYVDPLITQAQLSFVQSDTEYEASERVTNAAPCVKAALEYLSKIDVATLHSRNAKRIIRKSCYTALGWNWKHKKALRKALNDMREESYV